MLFHADSSVRILLHECRYQRLMRVPILEWPETISLRRGDRLGCITKEGKMALKGSQLLFETGTTSAIDMGPGQFRQLYFHAAILH